MLVEDTVRNNEICSVLEVEPTESAGSMGLKCEQNRRVTNDTKYLV